MYKPYNLYKEVDSETDDKISLIGARGGNRERGTKCISYDVAA